MMSNKGFLTPNADKLPRMTVKQKAAVEKAVTAVLDHYVRLDKTASLSMVVAALESYPTDRSCHTCDYLDPGGYCDHWKVKPPDADALEAGCDHHQDHAAPF